VSKPFDGDLELKALFAPVSDELLIEALTHKSWSFENSGSSYDRLEFIGDAIVQYIVSLWLFRKFSTSDEGFLTEQRQRYVSTEYLAKIAATHKLQSFILLGVGMNRHTEQVSPKMLADVVESLIAAHFLSTSIDQSQIFVHKLLHLN
jgi:ribonuclease-3